MDSKNNLLLIIISKAIDQLKVLGAIEHRSDNYSERRTRSSEPSHILRNELLAVLLHTTKTIQDEMNITPLRDFITQAYQVASYENSHSKEEQEAKIQLASLQQQLASMKIMLEEREANLNQRIAELKDTLAYETANTESKLQYALKYEDELGHECCKRLAERQCKLEDEIMALEKCLEKEGDRGKMQQSKFCDEIRELENQLQVLQTTHSIQMTDLQAEIDNLTSHQQQQDTEIRNLRQKCELCLQVVESDRIAKAAARQLQLQREKLLRAAIAIQAWWRRIMVRKGLGPFHKKKRGTHPKQRQHSNTREKKSKVAAKSPRK